MRLVRHVRRRGRLAGPAAALLALVLGAGLGAGLGPQERAAADTPKEPRAAAGASAAADAPAGPLAAGQFRNPVNTGPDPTLVHHQGNYYVATTQGDALRIWKSPSVATLLTGDMKEVWRDSDPSRNQQIWAPTLFRSGDRWYLYYTASNGQDSTHRMYVLESAGTDPMGPYHFKAKLAAPGSDRWAIDGEPFQLGGRLYFSWSGEREDGVRNQLFLAPMSNPWTISGARVHLPADGNCPEVREGPTPLTNSAGRLFLTYSACDTGKPDYAIWAKSIAPGANPLDPGAWTQEPGPLFSRDDADGVYGPGHHFFFKSPDGTEDWMAYHAKSTSALTYSWRTTRVQKIGWTPAGKPALGSPVSLGHTMDLPSGDPGPGTRAINDTDLGTGDFQVSYGGAWSSGSGCAVQCFWGNDHWSGATNATATFRFTGTRIALLSVKDTGNGIAAISVDGGPEQRVDYYGTPRVGEQLQYISPKLAPGSHTLTVRVTGEKNPASGAAIISVDRAEVYP
ncbi:glycoside hydrolase family 43 protein [Streptomyces sp. NPDC050433]|uniref:glycoside hydrolase family 43 protein n=1 Tax=unclassified Streptomyces TaxID=2593676 RepID=UPI00343E6DB6